MRPRSSAVGPFSPRRLRGRLGLRVQLGVLVASSLGALLIAGSIRAEIYEWTDQQGRLHFAQDLNQVPPQYRSQAEREALADGAGPRIQHYRSVPAAPAADSSRRAGAIAGGASSSGTIHRIRVAGAGSSMQVMVRLNDRVDAPFVIDTGATDVVMPQWVAEKLGLDLERARTQHYRTANGVIESRIVTLESVELGGARANDVPASVSRSMSVGLLGLSFFNHFEYQVDPAAGIVTLRDNGLAEQGRIRGGRSEAQWRSQFHGLTRRRELIESALEDSGDQGARRREELEAAVEEVDRQLGVLEEEADAARVPMRWRD